METTIAIYRAMTSKGISQKELAKLVGLSESSLSRRMSGAVEFRLDELRRITRILGIKKGELL